MKSIHNIYVTAQNSLTREWIPVAELLSKEDGYVFRYTKGAARLPGFSGLGRMQDLDQVYHSSVLFPFFANRLIPKSRPEYRDYLRWIGLDVQPASPMEFLSITGGGRATDGYQLIAPPVVREEGFSMDFFARGLRYLPEQVLDLLFKQDVGASLCLMRDTQNEKDECALAIRTTGPFPLLVGYVPRYYCSGISRLLGMSALNVHAMIKRLNKDAPFDMKFLLSIEARCPQGFDLLDEVSDFQPFSSEDAGRLSSHAILGTQLDLTSNDLRARKE